MEGYDFVLIRNRRIVGADSARAVSRCNPSTASCGEISRLHRRCRAYLVALQADRADRPRDAFNEDGGRALHVEATAGEVRGTRIVAFAG
jgi:hypothetical protein